MTRLAGRTLVYLMAVLCVGACKDRPAADPPAPEESAQEQPVRLMAVGDTLLADAAEVDLIVNGYDHPFEHLRDAVAGHDLLVGNLEGPITDVEHSPHTGKSWVYKQDREAVGALKGVGFDVVCLANNHTLDYGALGLVETAAALDRAGIGHFGAGEDLDQATAARLVDVHGIRIGFVGFYEYNHHYDDNYHFYARRGIPGAAPLKEQIVEQALARARSQADVLVVSFHWGSNYEDVEPSQIEWGHRAVDLGADLVIGHHPHVVQGVEVYRGVPILYSLGNFTFGTPGRFSEVEPVWRHGWIADVTIDDKRVTRVDLIPLETDNDVVKFQPRVAPAERVGEILETVNARFGTKMEVVDGRGRLEVPDYQATSRR